MSHLIKTPLFSYLVEYLNDESGFRESRIVSLNRSAVREIEAFTETRDPSQFVLDLKGRGFELNSIISHGSFDKFYPLHVQVELTDDCNLSCDYCYRNANHNNPQSTNIDFKKISNFLLRQKRNNLLEVGITGGEPTRHPQFVDILEFVLKNFELSELVTNGTNPNSILQVLDRAGEEGRRLNLSVSFNRWYRDLRNLEKGTHYLNPFLERVAIRHPVRMILTDIFYDSKKAEEAKEMLRGKGARDVDFSFVSPIGRGKEKVSELEHLPRFPPLGEDGFTPTPLNCGLVFKHTAVGPDGNLRPCALFPLEFCVGSIENGEGFIGSDQKLWAIPSPNSEICGPCDLSRYCVGCIYKGLFNSNPDCNYRKSLKENPNLEFLSHIGIE